MWMPAHEVYSEVTGGRPVFTSAAVGGGAPGKAKAGTGRGAFPTLGCARSDPAGSLGTTEKTS